MAQDNTNQNVTQEWLVKAAERLLMKSKQSDENVPDAQRRDALLRALVELEQL